jgi:uncharacterized protein
MKIVIADIPEEGLIADIDEKIRPEGIDVTSPVRAGFSINKIGTEVIVSGKISAELEFECSRCLKSFRNDIGLDVNVVYHPAAEPGHEKHALHDDEMDMGFYQGDEIDLNDLIKEQILLNTEMKPLCSESCRGICPRCGADLNTGSCDCVQKEIDPRLAVLKKLLDKGKE